MSPTTSNRRARSWAEINLHNLGRGAKFVRYRLGTTPDGAARCVEYWVAGSRGSWAIKRTLETRPVPSTPVNRLREKTSDMAEDLPSLRAVREAIAADLAATP